MWGQIRHFNFKDYGNDSNIPGPGLTASHLIAATSTSNGAASRFGGSKRESFNDKRQGGSRYSGA